jgi:hypothetical protein
MVQAVDPDCLVLSGALEREFRRARLMLASFPPAHLEDRPPDCGRSAQELAWAFVERERLMLYVLIGRTYGFGAAAPKHLETILAEYDSARRKSRAALAQLKAEQWREQLRGPAGLMGWESSSRGELLFAGWKELVHHTAHFAVHLRLAQKAEARAPVGAEASPA